MSKVMPDIFNGAEQVVVKQTNSICDALLEWAWCGEASNRFRISVPWGDAEEGDPMLYVDERSSCCCRFFCYHHRPLTYMVHNGATKDNPVIMEMEKPFSFRGCCCCCRPHVTVYDVDADGTRGQRIGHVDEPWRCMSGGGLRHSITHQENGSRQVMHMKQDRCQCGGRFPCCLPVNMSVKRGDRKVASISKRPLDVDDLIMQTKRFTLSFGSVEDSRERRLLLASLLLADLEYFGVWSYRCGFA